MKNKENKKEKEENNNQQLECNVCGKEIGKECYNPLYCLIDQHTHRHHKHPHISKKDIKKTKKVLRLFNYIWKKMKYKKS